MQRIILVLAFLLILPTLAKAEPLNVSEQLAKLPSLNQGIAFDARNSEFNYITTADILTWKDFTLGGGYSADNKLVATIAYDIGGFKKLGIDVPILNYVDLRVGAYLGMSDFSTASSDDRNKLSWGPSVTIVSIKF